MTEMLTILQQLKISCLSSGIRITKIAENKLSNGGSVPLSIHEYATTGGVTMLLEGGIYINAPFDEWYCDSPEAILTLEESSDEYVVHFRGNDFHAELLPLPGYLEMNDSDGNPVKDTTMSHADRVRISPIFGCSFKCEFCDFYKQRYVCRPVKQILEGLTIARKDKLLPVKHVVISGGTPSQRDYGYIDEVYERVIRSSDIPVDVMLAPRKDDIIDRLADWGIYGYSINIEIYNEGIAGRIAPHKKRIGLDQYAATIARAVQQVGGQGRVRSLLLVGLEPEESTLKGVEFLAQLGCDPVLSPFRPAAGTPLEHLRPPTTEQLENIYLKSLDIVEHYGVKLGPRCIPCQHNTLTFPIKNGGYYYS